MMSVFRRSREAANQAADAPAAAATHAGIDAQALVARLSRQSSQLGREAAEVRGVIDDTNKVAASQAQAVNALAQQLHEVVRVQDVIGSHTRGGADAVARARGAVEQVGTEVGGIVETLRHVADAAGQITQIALQTRLVAFNASVEAKRAGEAGRGFGVVADAVKDLAAKVETSSKEIMGTVSRLDTRIEALAREINASADTADGRAGAVHRALDEVEAGVGRIAQAATQSRNVCDGLKGRMGEIEGEMLRTTRALDNAMSRSEAFLKISEQLIEMVAECGVETEDTPYIRAAQDAAGHIGRVLEDALRTGTVTAADLFDERYQPMPGTNPPQHTTRYAAVADRLFPSVQERVLGMSDKVVFAISADRNGYVAMHNRKYSQPQRGDVAWDTAHSRWRRIFNDRTGLSSARNQRPFLLQTYRRDMGGGQFVVMKEAAAPIVVNGRHWGGFRLGFKF
jgi:methyl-accepting chemotaxis protein